MKKSNLPIRALAFFTILCLVSPLTPIALATRGEDEYMAEQASSVPVVSVDQQSTSIPTPEVPSGDISSMDTPLSDSETVSKFSASLSTDPFVTNKPLIPDIRVQRDGDKFTVRFGTTEKSNMAPVNAIGTECYDGRLVDTCFVLPTFDSASKPGYQESWIVKLQDGPGNKVKSFVQLLAAKDPRTCAANPATCGMRTEFQFNENGELTRKVIPQTVLTGDSATGGAFDYKRYTDAAGEKHVLETQLFRFDDAENPGAMANKKIVRDFKSDRTLTKSVWGVEYYVLEDPAGIQTPSKYRYGYAEYNYRTEGLVPYNLHHKIDNVTANDFTRNLFAHLDENHIYTEGGILGLSNMADSMMGIGGYKLIEEKVATDETRVVRSLKVSKLKETTSSGVAGLVYEMSYTEKASAYYATLDRLILKGVSKSADMLNDLTRIPPPSGDPLSGPAEIEKYATFKSVTAYKFSLLSSPKFDYSVSYLKDNAGNFMAKSYLRGDGKSLNDDGYLYLVQGSLADLFSSNEKDDLKISLAVIVDGAAKKLGLMYERPKGEFNFKGSYSLDGRSLNAEISSQTLAIGGKEYQRVKKTSESGVVYFVFELAPAKIQAPQPSVAPAPVKVMFVAAAVSSAPEPSSMLVQSQARNSAMRMPPYVAPAKTVSVIRSVYKLRG